MQKTIDRVIALFFGASIFVLLCSVGVATAYALSCRGVIYDSAPLTLKRVEVEGQPVDDLSKWQKSSTHRFETYLHSGGPMHVVGKNPSQRQLTCLEVRAWSNADPNQYNWTVAQRRCFEHVLGGRK